MTGKQAALRNGGHRGRGDVVGGLLAGRGRAALAHLDVARGEVLPFGFQDAAVLLHEEDAVSPTEDAASRNCAHKEKALGRAKSKMIS